MQTDFYYLMMEYCPDGDLRNQIRQKSNLGEKFDIEQVVEWSLQVASALKFCHDHNVIHRDLKVRTKIVFWSDSFYFSPKTFFLCIKADGRNWQILVLPERQKARPCKPRRMLAPFHTWRQNWSKVRLLIGLIPNLFQIKYATTMKKWICGHLVVPSTKCCTSNPCSLGHFSTWWRKLQV